MSSVPAYTLTIRIAENHELRERFYKHGPKRGHDAYVKVAHVLGAALYQGDSDWQAAKALAGRALKELDETR